jgi:hypothetical protein
VKYQNQTLVVNEEAVRSDIVRQIIPVHEIESHHEVVFENKVEFKQIFRTTKNCVFELQRVDNAHADFIVRLSNFIPLIHKLNKAILEFGKENTSALGKLASQNSLNYLSEKYTRAI